MTYDGGLGEGAEAHELLLTLPGRGLTVVPAAVLTGLGEAVLPLAEEGQLGRLRHAAAQEVVPGGTRALPLHGRTHQLRFDQVAL